MPQLIPRLRRRLDRDRWMAVGEGSRQGGVTTYPPPNARNQAPSTLEEPVLQDRQFSPPPTYNQVRNTHRPEIAALIPERPHTLAEGPRLGSPVHIVSPIDPSNVSTASRGLTSCNLTSLQDIRHEDTAQSIRMEATVSSVPNDPVYIEPPPQNPSTSHSRRISRQPVRTSNTTGLFMSLGALPGVEPFEPQPLLSPTERRQQPRRSQTVPQQNLQPSNISSSGSTPVNADIMTASGVVDVVSPPMSPESMSSGIMRRQNDTVPFGWHKNSLDFRHPDRQRWRWRPPAEGYYAPPALPPRQRTWPSSPREDQHAEAWNNSSIQRGIQPASWRAFLERQQQQEQRQRPSSRDFENDTPPPVPPKDPGYVPRRRPIVYAYRLRTCHSSPLLRSPPHVSGSHTSRTAAENADAGTNRYKLPRAPFHVGNSTISTAHSTERHADMISGPATGEPRASGAVVPWPRKSVASPRPWDTGEEQYGHRSGGTFPTVARGPNVNNSGLTAPGLRNQVGGVGLQNSSDNDNHERHRAFTTSPLPSPSWQHATAILDACARFISRSMPRGASSGRLQVH